MGMDDWGRMPRGNKSTDGYLGRAERIRTTGVDSRVKILTPYCGNCGHESLHWQAAGQDICTHDGCDCEWYCANFESQVTITGPNGVPFILKLKGE